MLDFNYLLYCY